MNNDLEQFSEEYLKELINSPADELTIALARIALSVKQANPEYHIVRLELNDAWGGETVLNAYESQLDASKCKDDHGGVIIPCYTTPQPAHAEVNSPEIPDGWKLVPIEPTHEMLDAGGGSFGTYDVYRDMIAESPIHSMVSRYGNQPTPMQPLCIDQFGTLRFKVNPIVQHLLDVAGNVGVNMNTIAMQGFEPEDQMQFAQLIGYSLGGYGDLSYVTDESYERASAAAPKPESE